MSVKNITFGTVALAVPYLCFTAPVMAQQQAGEPAPPVIEADAIAALEKVGSHLQSLESFALKADTVIDEVLSENGQKIQLSGTLNFQVQRPSHLFVDVASDRKQRQYIYDGKTVTVHGPKINYYTVFEAPETIREMLTAASDGYDITMPLGDLFVWGTEHASTDSITSALDIGPSVINGETCDHFAYRQEGVDWQLWIRQGDQPLPCKLVITTTDEEAQPQYSAVLSWDTTATFDASTFTFTPPEGAHRIKIAANPAEQN